MTRRIEVRSTINLRGLPHGSTALVDPTDPYISGLLTHAYLIPTRFEDVPEPEEPKPAAKTKKKAARASRSNAAGEVSRD